MEIKIDFKVKTEALMQTIAVVTAIASTAGIIISLNSTDRVTNTAAIAVITILAILLRIK